MRPTEKQTNRQKFIQLTDRNIDRGREREFDSQKRQAERQTQIQRTERQRDGQPD